MSGLNKDYYTISSSSTTWVITHNLGVEPIVNVLIDLNGQKTPAFPLSISHNIGRTTVTITWATAKTGEVHLLY